LKRIDKDFEMLSSYLDGELSPDDVKKIEEKISYTIELRNKLNELKKLKELTKTSIKRLPESPYFETRLFAYLEEKPYRYKIKKWFPVIGVTVLTITIMFFLKFNPGFIEEIFEEQKSNLAGFYKENLKPLLFAADLSNEDIFNFAFYNQLPLNESKSQIIQLGSDPSGNEYFEIKTVSLNTGENNFEKFIETLDLSDKQLVQYDSIMNSYAEALQSQILINDKNTVAISPKLWNYQKAIVADILSFAKSSNEKVFADVMPVLYKVQSPVVEQIVHAVKSSKDNDYIFLTPDSLFIESFEFDADEFNKEMEIARKEMKQGLEEMKKNHKEMRESDIIRFKLDSALINLKKVTHADNNIGIYSDSNICRVHIDKIEIPNIELPDMDDLNEIINEATKQIKSFSFTFPKLDKRIHKYDYKIRIDDSSSTYNYNFDVEIPNVDSIIENEMKNLENFNLPHGKAGWNGVIPNDSLIEWFNFFKNDDSTYVGNPKQFEFKMKEFEEQMQKFKEEMEKLKKEIRKDTVKVKQKKPVEI